MAKKIYMLYRTDEHHSVNSRDLLVVADDLSVCYKVAKEDNATEDQLKELEDSYFHQTQCNNVGCEYEICTYTLNESLIS